MRGALLVIGSLIIAVIVDSCKSQDLENIEPFSFKIDFETPEIEIEADVPAIVEPVVPSVQPSAAAQQLTSQVTSSSNPADVPAAVQTSISTASAIATSSGVTPAQVQAFDQSDLKTITSTPPAQLDQNILKASKAAAENPVIKNLFPALKLPGGRIADNSLYTGNVNPVLREDLVLAECVGGLDSDEITPECILEGLCGSFYPTFLLRAQLGDKTAGPNATVCPGGCRQINCFQQRTGSCADNARKQFALAYKEGRLYAFDLQTNGLDKIYNPLLSEIPGRKTKRDNAAKAIYDASILSLENQVKELLDAADRFQKTANQTANPFDIQIAADVRFFSLLYFYYYYSIIVSSYVETLEINSRAAGEEEANINVERTFAFNRLEFKFYDEILTKIEQAFIKASDNCHNQGLGS